jgi:predicted nucleic acid-binding protein
MIVLDTNVLSEMMGPKPEPTVETWLANQAPADVFITAVTEAELRYGLALLPAGKRRARMAAIMYGILTEDFRNRILPFDSPAAITFAEIAASRRQTGRPISQADAQIAAIARSRAAAIATRNTPDFDGCGVEIINPWLGKS